MPYSVEVDWAPAYELETSLLTLVFYRRYAKTLDIGDRWVARVREQGGKELADALASADGLYGGLDLLVWQCPDKGTVESTLGWLSGLTAGEVYERMVPHMPDVPQNKRPSAVTSGGAGYVESLEARTRMRNAPSGGGVADLAGVRDRLVRLFMVWNRAYFQSVDPRVLAGLASDADSRRRLVGEIQPEDLIEDATCGVRLDPVNADVRVVLVPQYHLRPWNTYNVGRNLVFYHYPVDAVPPELGAPSPALLHLTRALSDENRLKMLRFLASGPRSFTEVAKFSGLAKSTVHHHMVALRAAGLVRMHVHFGGGPDRYSLRPGALETMGASLVSYLKGE